MNRPLLALIFLIGSIIQGFGQFNQIPVAPGTCGGNCVTPLNGNGTLGQIYNNSACGLNYVSFSQRIGQRFSPAGTGNPSTFSIAGIPPCANNPGGILRAYLWAGTSGNGAAMSVSITNPLGTTQNFPMTVVGSGPDKCWSYAGTYTYRADVTSIITGNGNYTLNGFLVGGTNDVDGATLLIIYQDPTANYRGSLIIHDGCVVINGGTTTQTITGIGACANSTTARAFSCIADLQMAGTLTMNGTAAPFTFNWWNYTEVNTTVTNGQATSNYTMTSTGDCYNFAVMGLYYQTTSCTTCPGPNPLTLNMSSTQSTCTNCDGTATVTPSGVSGPYTYSWAPSGGTGATATNLCPGTYTVTVSANGGCLTRTATVTITPSSGGVTVSGTTIPATCNGSCNGSITASATGGIGPYTYTWAPSGGPGPSSTGLCAGTYTVTATSTNGCTGSQTFTVTQPALLSVTTTPTNINCYGAGNGSITATASGGTGGYTYAWLPSGGSGPTASGLSPGTYTVTVTDANGCTRTSSATITQPTQLTATITAQTNVSCYGGANGTATVTGGGGTGAYTYAWAPSGGSGATGTGLGAGTYTVTLTDANGCTRTATATITQPTQLTATITAQTNVSCYGGTNGSATVTPGGGSGAYTYAWAPSGGAGATATGLGAGTYTVTVTDANGCTRTATATITQPPQLTATISGQTNVTCFGGTNGSATVSAGGGTGAYTYAWLPSGGSGATGTGMGAGTYTVTVTDANGCTRTTTATITQPTQVTATISSITNVLCSGSNNGSATVTPGGGTGAYTYAWLPSGGNGPTASGLGPGTYTVTVTDANGCTRTTTANITQPGNLNINVTATTNPNCFGSTDGSVTVSASGGSGAYTYAWSPNTAYNGSNATNLGAGGYTVTVTDANNCTASTSTTLTDPAQLNIGIATSGNITCYGSANGWANTSVSGGTGNLDYLWAPGNGTVANPTNMPPGNYTVTVTDQNNCSATASVNITEPTQLTASMTAQTDVTCYGYTNGSATVSGSGGTGAYTYGWSGNGGSNPTASGLAANTYTATITDANGCTATATVTITQPALFTAQVSSPDPQICVGEGTSITATENGGVPGYSYTWSGGLPPGANPTVSPVTTTTYTVTITDGNSCTASNTITITVSPLPVPSFTAPAVCLGSPTTFTSTSTVSSGSIGSVTWNYGDLSSGNGSPSTHTYGAYGSYNVTLVAVSDQGCVDSITSPVTVHPTPQVNFTADVVSGCDPVCVNFSDLSTLNGGTLQTASWSANGTGIGTGSNLNHCFTAGAYDITLDIVTTDGCTGSLTIPNYINSYPIPVAEFFITPNVIYQSEPVASITDASTNAAAWSFDMGDGNTVNSQNFTHTYVDTGTYCITLTVTSPNGCTDTEMHCLHIQPEFMIYIPNTFTPNDDKINDIFNISGLGITKMEMIIFDRWGELIYSTTDMTLGWNGILGDGTPAKQDVYVYKIYLENAQKDHYDYTGKLNLVR